jgi:hypothetical protein
VLCAGVANYLLLGVLWAFAFVLVARLQPGSFAFNTPPESGRAMEGFTALYFSLVTLCTVGFGDIVPTSQAARMLTLLEGIAGVFYIAIMLSRLVALHAAAQAAQSRRDSPV